MWRFIKQKLPHGTNFLLDGHTLMPRVCFQCQFIKTCFLLCAHALWQHWPTLFYVLIIDSCLSSVCVYSVILLIEMETIIGRFTSNYSIIKILMWLSHISNFVIYVIHCIQMFSAYEKFGVLICFKMTDLIRH